MTTILLDSDILIEVLRGRDEAILARWQGALAEEYLMLYSPVTAAEIWHGVLGRERITVEKLFSVLTCVPIDAETGRQAGAFLRSFSKSHGLQLGDAMIAAAAVIHGVPLWTRNRKRYPMKKLELFQ